MLKPAHNDPGVHPYFLRKSANCIGAELLRLKKCFVGLARNQLFTRKGIGFVLLFLHLGIGYSVIDVRQALVVFENMSQFMK